MQILRGITLGSAAAAVACGAVYRPQELRSTLDRQDPERARELLDVVLTDPKSHATKSTGRETGRLLLERGSVRWALGDYAGCADDLDRADRLLDRQAMGRSQYLTAGHNPQFTTYMYERGWAQALNLPYGAKFYERLLINPLAALCRLELGDGVGACTEMRRFGVMADWTEQVASGRATPVRAFGEIVAVLACTGVDATRACSSLERARRLAPDVLEGSGLSCELPRAGGARLAVLVGYGRPCHPEGEPDKPVRFLCGDETRDERITVAVDGKELVADELIDIASVVRADYEDGLHALHVKFLGLEGDTGDWAREAWESLPAHVHLALADMPPGEHELTLDVRGRISRRALTLAAGQTRTVAFSAPW